MPIKVSSNVICRYEMYLMTHFRGSNPLLWSLNVNHYSDVSGDDVACVVGFSETSGDVYYQSAVSIDQCSRETFQYTIIGGIHASGGTEGKVVCCQVDGCNWSPVTAKAGLHIDEFSKKDSDDDDDDDSGIFGGGASQIFKGVDNWVAYLLIGLTALLILLCCFCVCCIRVRNNRRRAQQEQTYGDPAALDRAVRARGSRGAQRIDVAPSPVPGQRVDQIFDPKDHERYSAIDRRIYHR